MRATAEDTALLVFNHWYYKNRLPFNFGSDRDKLFMSCFWKALFQLSGVKLKMTSGYHPQTDSSSECMNKSINQAIRFHVKRNQKGWVQVLPRIQFCMMNVVNASTGYSGFQLHLGQSPCIIPPIVPSVLSPDLHLAGPVAETVITQLQNDIANAKDNLLLVKVAQAHYAKKSHGDKIMYNIGDKVMLSTFHQ